MSNSEKINGEGLTIKILDKVEEMVEAFPLINQMYTEMDLETYQSHVAEMISLNNFKMVVVFKGDKIIGACGYWVFLMLYCERYIQVSNFVVDEQHRNLGVGKMIIRYIENLGRKLGCKKFILDSYTENKRSHSLYYKEGFYIRGFHFMKNL